MGKTFKASLKGSGGGVFRMLPSLSPSLQAYYLAFGLHTVGSFIKLTTFETVFGVPRDTFVSMLHVVILALLIAKFLSQRMSLFGWICSIAIALLGILSMRWSAESWLLWLCLFLVCSDGVELKYLAVSTLVVVAVMFVVTIACCNMGLIPNRVFTRGSSLRPSYGFKHPNYFGSYLLLLCVSVSVLRFGKNPLPDIFMVICAAVVDILLVDSRSTFIALVGQLVLLLIFYFTKQTRMRKILSVIIVVAITVFVICSFYFMVRFNPNDVFQNSLDSLLSGRLRLAHGYYSLQPLTLFGDDFVGFEPIYWEQGEPAVFLVDNSYCHLVLRYGIIPTLIALISIFVLLIKQVRDVTWSSLFFGLALMLVYGVCENLGIRVEFNYFLVGIGTELLYSHHLNILKKSRESEKDIRQ